MSKSDILNNTEKLRKLVDDGHLSMFEEFNHMKTILKQLDNKNARKYYAQFLHVANVTYSPRRQIYFLGKQNRKGSGKALRLRDMPKIALKFENFVSQKLE